MKLSLHRYPLSRGGSWSIVTICVMHIYQAVLLHGWPISSEATNVTSMMLAFRLVNMPKCFLYLQIILVTSAILALFSTLFRVGCVRLVVFLPQHLLLGAMAFGGVLAAVQGMYLDGTLKPWSHISIDQVGYIALFSIHSSAIIRRCRDLDG